MGTKIILLIFLLSSTLFSQQLGEAILQFNGISIDPEFSLQEDGQHIGVLSVKLKINRDINKVDEQVLEQVKISLIKYLTNPYAEYSDLPLEIDVTALSFNKEDRRKTLEKRYQLTEVEILDTNVKYYHSIGKETEIILGIGISWGFASENMVDQDELYLTDDEIQNQLDTRDHFTNQFPGMKAGAFVSKFRSEVGLRLKNAYALGFYDFRKSGNYNRIEDNPNANTQYGYFYLFDWERRMEHQLGVELGLKVRIVKGYPKFRLYATYFKNTFKSRATIAEQGTGTFYETQEVIKRPDIVQNFLKVGVEIPIDLSRR